MATISMTSNDGQLSSASAVLELSATNPEYNQPVLRVKQAGTRGGAASIRIDDPNPDIEFVETDLKNPPDPGAGKFEIAVQSDRLQINGRRAAVSPGNRDSTLSSSSSGRRRAAISVSDSRRPASSVRSAQDRGAIVIANASVAPTGNVAGAGILYVQDGALKYRGSSGTVTVIAPA